MFVTGTGSICITVLSFVSAKRVAVTGPYSRYMPVIQRANVIQMLDPASITEPA
jgi:hypothetical protein